MGYWVHDKVHVKSLDFFEPCVNAAKSFCFQGVFGFHPSSFPGPHLDFSRVAAAASASLAVYGEIHISV